MTTATTKLPAVCITRCSKCGDESYGLAPAAGECPRCGRDFRSARWINSPHVATVVRAMREHATERKLAEADDILSAIEQVRAGKLSGKELERRSSTAQLRRVPKIMAAAALTDPDEHRLAAIRIACAD